MKRAFDSGARLWNSAQFYGTPEYNSLHLLHAYFTKYPEDAPHVVLMVKIGMDPETRKLACDEAGIRKSYDTCSRILGNVKKIDILLCERVDPEVPVEETVGALKRLVDEGKVGGIGMSECSAASLRRAAKVTKIEAVEVEFSMFTPDILSNGVAKAARDIGAAIVAYSPLGRGMLTGSVTGLDSLAENDPKRAFPRFEKEALEQNLRLVKEVEAIAHRLGASKGQVALAWVRARSDASNMPQILPIPGTKSVARLDENMQNVVLSETDLKELDELVERFPAVGERYPGAFAKLQWG